MSRQITSGPLLGLYSWTAVYDISEHTVYLPDGTKLEAHSGKGNRLDDPRYVQERMRGATPPNVYELALREKTFHGVQALRLKPVSGGNTFGRSGLLAHTYMLGPRGESNGCVVFKNYNVFLQAFQNGQVKQLIVVDNLKVRNGYELTLAQASFAPTPLKISDGSAIRFPICRVFDGLRRTTISRRISPLAYAVCSPCVHQSTWATCVTARVAGAASAPSP